MKAFMFSGQGSQYTGMGKELYEQFPEYRAVYDTASQSLGYDLAKLSFEENDLLSQTEYTQPALLTMSTAGFTILEKIGMHPDYLLGLSLGEYSALVASSALDFSEAVALVQKRGRFMTEAVPEGLGAMCAVLGLDSALVEEACVQAAESGKVYVANYNTVGQVVISGEKSAVEKAAALLSAQGGKTIMLNVSGPFHTELLKPAAEKLRAELLKLSIKEPKIPVITNLTGEKIPSKDEIIPTLTRQVMSPVLWEKSIRHLLSLGVDTFIEIGPGKTLCGFVKKIDKSVAIYNVENLSTLEKLKSSLGV